MPFTNPILAGDGTLIPEDMQSDGFVAGSTGWRIARDGSAEFDSVTLRGDLRSVDPDGLVEDVGLVDGELTWPVEDDTDYDAVLAVLAGTRTLVIEGPLSPTATATGLLGTVPRPTVTLLGLEDGEDYDDTDPDSNPRVIVEAGATLFAPATGLGGVQTVAVSGDIHTRTEFGGLSNLGPVVQPTGLVSLWAAPGALPRGWLECDGSAVSRTGETSDLFAVLGTTWGAGDGSTTFNLPDLRGQVPLGHGGAVAGAVGATGGSVQHHARIAPQAVGGANGTYADRIATPSYATNRYTAGSVSVTTQNATTGARVAGDDDDSNALPPYALVRYIICT